ncbi:hypothetical protein N0039_28445, partial [Pseudomonas aeruginosa]|nr:hypothetical protein [Pseudomonas aeruginosa]
ASSGASATPAAGSNGAAPTSAS